MLADELVARLVAKAPNARLIKRDLARSPVRPLDGKGIEAIFTPGNERNIDQEVLVAEYDELIDEIASANVIVIGAPMYNLNISVQLKSYLDAVARAGKTFRYTANGPEGLLSGKKCYVVTARGGKYRGTSADSQTPFLRSFLKLIGISDVEFIYAEGMNMGNDVRLAGLSEARQLITEIAV